MVRFSWTREKTSTVSQPSTNIRNETTKGTNKVYGFLLQSSFQFSTKSSELLRPELLGIRQLIQTIHFDARSQWQSDILAINNPLSHVSRLYLLWSYPFLSPLRSLSQALLHCYTSSAYKFRWADRTRHMAKCR